MTPINATAFSIPALLPGHWKDMPKLPGVYVIYLRDEPIYIGQSENLRRRFKHHQIDISHINGKRFYGLPEEISVRYLIEADKPRRLVAEWHFVSKLKPQLNIQLVNRIRSPRVWL